MMTIQYILRLPSLILYAHFLWVKHDKYLAEQNLEGRLKTLLTP